MTVTLEPLDLAADVPPVGIADAARWQAMFQQGWAHLVNRHRPVADEVRAAIRVLEPLDAPQAGLVSATCHDAFGAIGTSLPGDPATFALTLAHELQHNKLVGLHDLAPLVEAGCRDSFYAPWRDDPRPLIGLLHGLYAHVGVTQFWRSELEAGIHGPRRLRAEVEFLHWRDACADVAGDLHEHRGLTPTGRYLVRQLSERVRRWYDYAASRRAIEEARARRERHRAKWTSQARRTA